MLSISCQEVYEEMDEVVDSRGLEPLTFALPARRSSQLNYEPSLVLYYTR